MERIVEKGERAFLLLKDGQVDKMNIILFLEYLSNYPARIRAYGGSKIAQEEARKRINEVAELLTRKPEEF